MNLDELKLLYEQLCRVVPKQERSDGLESETRYALPAEVEDREIKYAALMLNEISGFLDEEPGWLDVAIADARRALNELGVSADRSDGTTKPASEADFLSREWHALQVLELARHYLVVMSWAKYEGSDEDPSELDDTPSWMAEAAKIAFEIGRHMQASWNKPFEPHAIRGMRVIAAATASGYARRNEARNNRIIAEMTRLIECGNSIDRAAELAAAHGIGASKVANSKVWYRHREKNQLQK